MGSPTIPHNTDDSNNSTAPKTIDESSPQEKPIDSGTIQYMGGHKAYPQSAWTYIYFYEDRFEIQAYHLKVPYAQIKDVGNTSDEMIDADRVFLAGIIGLFWKKRHVYTVITYHDGIDDQKIVIDFDNNANYAQGLIYKKMLQARKSK